MGEAAFRLVYKKPEDRDYLENWDISEISLDGVTLQDVVKVELSVMPHGVPELKLHLCEKSKLCNGIGCTEPLLGDIEIDGWVKLNVTTYRGEE
jgi:hypothetical protein